MTCWRRRVVASASPAWSAPAPPSPTRSPSTCAGLSTTGNASPPTLRDYNSIIRAHLLPAFGDQHLEDITTDQVEHWSASLAASGRMNNRTRLKILTVLHGMMGRAKRVWKLPSNPISDVEKPIQTRSTAIDVFCAEEVMALVRAADSVQDAAIYLTAAFTGLRRGGAHRTALAQRSTSLAATSA